MTGSGGRFCLVLGLLLLLFFSDSLLRGRPLSPADLVEAHPALATGSAEPRHRLMTDVVYVFEPWRELGFEALRQGRVPRLNPRIYCGVPYAANFQTAAYYPSRLVPASVSARLHALGHAFELFLAGLGFYLLAGFRGLGEPARWLGGLVWAFCGFLVVWKLWPMSAAALMLPWLWLGLELALAGRYHRAVALTAAAVALSWLGGHPQTTGQMLLVGGIYALYRLASRVRAPAGAWAGLGRWGAGIALGTGAVCFFLLPAASYLLDSHAWQRRVADHSVATAVNLPSLPGFLFPFLWGSRLAGSLPLDRVVGAYNTNELGGGYVSFLLPLVLVPLAWQRRRQIREFRFWAACLGVSVCLAINLPPFATVYGFIPVIGSAKPARMILFAGVAMLMLAIEALDALRKRPPTRRELGALVGILAVVGVGAVATGGAFRLLRPTVQSEIEARLPAWSGRLAESPALRDATAEELTLRLERTTVRYPLWIGSAALLAIVALVAASGHGPLRRLREGPLIALVVVDLFAFGRAYTPAIEPDRLHPVTPAIRFLQENAGDHRVAAAGKALPPNLFSTYGLDDIRGVDALEPREYMELAIELFGMQNALPPNFKFFAHPDYTHPLVDFLGLKYLVTDRPLEQLVPDPERRRRFQLVFTDGPEVFVYENREALPGYYLARRLEVEPEPAARLARMRRWMVSERSAVVESGRPAQLAPSASVERVAADDRSLRFTGEFPDGGFLVVASTFHAGWRCSVDGRPQSVERVNHAFLGVRVPEDAREIVFTYRTPWLGTGVALSMLSAALAIWLATRRRRRDVSLPSGA